MQGAPAVIVTVRNAVLALVEPEVTAFWNSLDSKASTLTRSIEALVNSNNPDFQEAQSFICDRVLESIFPFMSRLRETVFVPMFQSAVSKSSGSLMSSVVEAFISLMKIILTHLSALSKALSKAGTGAKYSLLSEVRSGLDISPAIDLLPRFNASKLKEPLALVVSLAERIKSEAFGDTEELNTGIDSLVQFLNDECAAHPARVFGEWIEDSMFKLVMQSEHTLASDFFAAAQFTAPSEVASVALGCFASTSDKLLNDIKLEISEQIQRSLVVICRETIQRCLFSQMKSLVSEVVSLTPKNLTETVHASGLITSTIQYEIEEFVKLKSEPAIHSVWDYIEQAYSQHLVSLKSKS